MEASPARPKPERPVSGIPVPTSRRASLNKATFGTAESSVTLGQHRDLLQLSQPPPGKNSPIAQQRRHSTLGSNDRSLSSPSMAELQEKDDPAHLKAQIAMLKSSLTASHQRIIALTSDINLDSSTSSMSPSEAGSRRPSTPMGGLADLSIAEEFTPTSEHDGGTNGNGEGEVDEGVSLTLNGSALEPESRIPRLPKSVPSYDLRSTAVTPSRPDGQSFRKVSEGPLGLSRIPQSTVTQALILHDSPQHKGTLNTSPTSGRPASRARSTYSPTPSPGDMSNLRSPYLGPDSPYSPAGPSDGRFSPALGVRKTSGGSSAASTRVIDSLQTELLNAKGHVDKLKQEVRSNQRVIGSLTRQTEDLKETKERMRMECEGLNNVIARKERLLQEVLERARTAESSLATHVANKKALEQSTKKSLQQMTSQLADAQAAQLKADREASSLRDGVKSLRDAWTRELKAVRDEVKQAEEKGRDDTAAARQSHLELVRLVEAQASERATITSLAKEAMETSSRANTTFTTHIEELKAQLDLSNRETSEAKTTAAGLAEELIRLRRLMREPKRLSLEDAAKLE